MGRLLLPKLSLIYSFMRFVSNLHIWLAVGVIDWSAKEIEALPPKHFGEAMCGGLRLSINN